MKVTFQKLRAFLPFAKPDGGCSEALAELANSIITTSDGTASFEAGWSGENCAEVWAVRNTILSGVKLDNIMPVRNWL